MNNYMLSQIPLVSGFMLLLILAALKPWEKERLSGPIAFVAISLSTYFMWRFLPIGSEYFGGSIRVTSIGKVLAFLALSLAALATLLSEDYLEKVHIHSTDFRMVVLATALGIAHLSLAGDLATLFIAYELVSIPSYVLAGFSHRDARSNEAGLKYLLLGMFTSVLLLLGISFLYGATGEIHLQAIQDKLTIALASNHAGDIGLAKISLALILGALLFKTGSAPFHSWLPDVYQGTNLASLSIISAPVKVAAFGMLATLLWGPFGALGETWKPALIVAIILSVLLGNLQALLQTNLKRLLAYSAVVNAGFILIGVLSESASATLFYLGAYGITTIGTFAAFMALGSAKADVDEISDLQGLGKKHPLLALGLTVLLLSYAGIPLTAGFTAKFSVVLEALRLGPSLPHFGSCAVGVAVVASLISFFFYFRLVKSIWMDAVSENQSVAGHQLRWNYILVLTVSVALVLSLGWLIRIPGL